MQVRLIISLLYIFVLGYNLIALIMRRDKYNFMERLALSFGLGAIALTLFILLLSLLNIPLQFNTVIIMLSIIVLILTLWNIKNRNIMFGFCGRCKFQVDRKYILITVFLLVIVLFQIFYVFSEAITYPIHTCDSLSNWSLKGKNFFLEKSVEFSSIKRYNSYPLLIPLMETWVYMNLGKVDDILVKIIFPLFYLSLIIFFYYALKRFGFSRLYSLFFTAFLITNGGFLAYHASIAYADLPFTLFYTVATLFLYFWILDPQKNKYLLISGIFSGGCLWIKAEGMFMIGINIFVLFIYCFFNWQKVKKSYKTIVFYFISIVTIILPWIVFCKIHDFDLLCRVQTEGIDMKSLLSIIRVFVYIHLRPLDRFPAWGIFWLMFIITSLLNIKKNISIPRIYLSAIIVLVASVTVGLYLVTPTLVIYITCTLNRLLLHVFPICVFLMAFQVREILDYK